MASFFGTPPEVRQPVRAASHPLSGNSTHHGVEVAWTMNADFSCGTLSASLNGRETDPVTIQLSEPKVKMITPSSHVKMLAPRFVLMSARFFSITSINPSTPPDFSMRYQKCVLIELHCNLNCFTAFLVFEGVGVFVPPKSLDFSSFKVSIEISKP